MKTLRSRVASSSLAAGLASAAAVTVALGLGAPRTAWAQDGNGGLVAQAPTPPPPPPPVDEGSDHDRVVRRFGVTYFDVTDLPIANQLAPGSTPAAGSLTSSNVQAPVIGARYWINRHVGIDAGIGLGFVGGSTEAVVGGTDTSVNKTATNGFALHAGVPIAFATGRHYAFLLIPNTTIGFTTATFKAPAPSTAPDQDLSGFLFDIGARVGAEIYFGFIGVPQLALQATVGLSFRRSVFKWAAGGNSASDGTNSFGTNVQADPWSIFKDAVSATYYF
jgi:hypothetical protein